MQRPKPFKLPGKSFVKIQILRLHLEESNSASLESEMQRMLGSGVVEDWILKLNTQAQIPDLLG